MFSVGTSDLASGLSQVLLALVVVGLIASIVGVRAKKAGSSSVALDVAASLSFVWLVLCAVAVVFVTWQSLAGSNVLTSGAGVDWSEPDGTWSGGKGFNDPDAVDDGLPALIGGYSNGTQLEIVGLPLGIRLLFVSVQVLNIALAALPAVVVRAITVKAALGDPFAPRVAKTLWVSSLVVLVAGIVRDLIDPISQTLAAQAVLPFERADAGLVASPTFELTVQIWPFAAALVLAALAAVFRHGHRLQEERETLKRETDGLI
ncbi:hypothetical protein [Microbacterium sp. H1-D42]|uniref:hypothetical protein n=1 Tax=Microbacterium sp. H1-D42 TaxID=2925844 RepID=UPI001F53271D|nr:hypothetical protein [Microbacterium sp. H1-D42]UNK71411.1 hypothetical protein MNR00_02850 [Microbacterium sp. H1-D42]